MKKIFLILLFMISSICGQSLREFANPSDYPLVTTIEDGTTFGIRQNGVTRSTTFLNLKNQIGSGTTLKLSNNYWEGENTFGKAIGLASISSTTVARGLYYNPVNGRVTLNGPSGVSNLATLDDLIPFTLGDPSDVFLKSANNTVTGTNRYTGIEDFKDGIVYIPRYFGILPNFSSGGTSQFVWSDVDSLFHYSAKNTENDKWHIKVPTIQWLLDRGFGAFGSWIPISGSVSGVNSNVAANGGFWSLYRLYANYLSLREGNPIYDGEMTISHSGAGVGDGFKYKDGSNTYSVLNETSTTNLIKSYVDYNIPEVIDAENVTISFQKRRMTFYDGTNANEEFHLTVSDYSAGGMVSFFIQNLDVNGVSNPWLDISGVTETVTFGERPAPNFSDGALYRVTIEYVKSNLVLVHYQRSNL